jgi:DNA-binding transcriptional MocR family regulator
MWTQSTSPGIPMQGDRWTSIPNALHALADTPREFQVMAALLSYRWYATSPIIPSVDTLAVQVGCSRRTIRRTVAALEARGLIRREERRASDTRQMSNAYVLCGALLAFVTRIEASRVQEDSQPWQGRRSSVTDKGNERKEPKQTRASQPRGRPAQSTDDFFRSGLIPRG